METAGQGQAEALAGSGPEKCCRAGSKAIQEGGLWELPFSRSQGKRVSQVAPRAKVSLTLPLASWPLGGKRHILMRYDPAGKGRGSSGESPGLGKGDPASAASLLCKPLPLCLASVSPSEHKKEQ